MKTLDKEIEQIIEANLFLDSRNKLIDFYGEQQYKFLLSEIFEYCVLSNNETVLNRLLGKAQYLIEKFDQQAALYNTIRDLARLYATGFVSDDLLRLAKNKNGLFDAEYERIKSIRYNRRISLSESEGKLLESELEITDIEIERAFVLQQRKYWRQKFKAIDQQIEEEFEEIYLMSDSFAASYSMEEEHIDFSTESNFSEQETDEVPKPNRTKTRNILFAALLVLAAILIWYICSR